MLHEQREALDEMIQKIRSGRLTRRSFLQRAAVVGLSSSAAVSLLEACGGNSNSQGGNGASTSIIWQSEQDTTGTYKSIVDTFNNTIGKQKGIHVTWDQGPAETDTMLAKYNTMFRARQATYDVVSVDIVYPAQFASQGWISSISDTDWPQSERAKYLPGPIQGCTYQGKLWATPYRLDLGLLYYRTDLISTPPTTFDQLVSMSKSVSPSKVANGYVWQGSQYEGLVCDFVEVLYGYNGTILDPNDATKVTVNSPEALQALTEMVSWVGTISPSAVTTYQEDQSLGTWKEGNSAFMRNWPYAYAICNDPTQSKIPHKFDVTSLPYGGSGTAGHSALGGWNLAVNAYSRKQDQSKEFMVYMLSNSAQMAGILGASWTVTLSSVYNDPQVQAKQPFFKKLGPILANAKPRPVSPKYSDVSDVIQRNVYGALKKQMSPTQALSSMASQLTTLVS
ncbi:MAG TPA: ABC transporter substrate-binding protein [Dictyobacter sp.]|jgi:multiple sugar transport system substrate-binding protein|nr:ABC transporter substrate-binding protein [Dictyobacter sp.]